MIKKLLRKALGAFIFWLYRDYDGLILPGVYKKHHTFALDNSLELYLMGNLKLRSNQHIILNSATEQEKSQDGSRLGYHYGIWFNSELDQNGLPIRYVLDNGQLVKFNPHKHDWVNKINTSRESGGCVI